MLEFSNKGFLVPVGNIQASLEQICQEFVEKNPDETRANLFDGLKQFFRDLMAETGFDSILVWINGSFATNSANPKDIDFVYFLSYADADRFETVLSNRFSYPESLTIYGMDAYLVKLFPEDHPHYIRTQSDKAYWM